MFSDYLADDFVGSGGTRIYQLQGINTGEELLRIAYARSWEYDGDWDSFTGTKYEYLVSVV